MGIEDSDGDKSDKLHQLEDCLVSYAKEGKNVVIIIDEAHTIVNKEILEDLRMLLYFLGLRREQKRLIRRLQEMPGRV